MATLFPRPATGTAVCLMLSLPALAGAALAQDSQTEPDAVVLQTVVLSAEDQAKQALGTSTVTAEDLEKTPVVNDISEIVRKMPGVNLTGNTASGQRGNQRPVLQTPGRGMRGSRFGPQRAECVSGHLISVDSPRARHIGRKYESSPVPTASSILAPGLMCPPPAFVTVDAPTHSSQGAL